MAKAYHVIYTPAALKELKKMDPHQSKIILSWISENLEGCSNPRLKGKSLSGDRSGEWSYRIGSYRMLAEIIDSEIQIQVFKAGHRSTVYRPNY